MITLPTLRHKSQAGDTIVEVLIAVAIVSTVIVSAFTIANKSSLQIRAAQERSEAIKLGSSAIETIKAQPTLANALDSSDPSSAPYCVDLQTKAIIGGGPLPAPLTNDKGSDYNTSASCSLVSSDVTYNVSVTRVNQEGSFVIHVRWDRVGGGQRQDITFNYRLNP